MAIENFNNWEQLSSVRSKLNWNDTELQNNKVDKIPWRGLSTNDYTKIIIQ